MVAGQARSMRRKVGVLAPTQQCIDNELHSAEARIYCMVRGAFRKAGSNPAERSVVMRRQSNRVR